MFDAKKINQPYQFIDSLYHRLSGYLTDLEKIDPASPHETRGFVQAVLNWMNAYKDSPEQVLRLRYPDISRSHIMT